MTALLRTEYLNVNLGTVRTGATGHGESLTDLESYLLPMDAARGSTFHTWGVCGGLQVSATTGQPDLTISPGVALDSTGRLIVLAADGLTVVDPATEPQDLPNITTVAMPAAGLDFATAGLTGDLLLTITWLEALGQSTVANAPALLHAPWLRLVPTTTVPDGSQVLLATVSLAADSTVLSLTGDGRRATGTPSGSLVLRQPAATGTAPAVGIADAASVVLVGRNGGGLSIQLASGSDPSPTTLFLDQTGNLGLGIGDGPAERVLHVEGSEVHSGGNGGGFSFTDRAVETFVELPAAGQRWVWYAVDGVARLWSGSDRLSVSANGALTFTGDFGTPAGPATMSLWASQIGDVGNGTLFLRSGGSVVAFDGGDRVGIGTTSPSAPLDIAGGAEAYGMIARAAVDGIYANGSTGYGAVLYGGAAGLYASGTGGRAIFANGAMTVTGMLSKAGGGFRIDNPKDPENSYLSHSFVESPDMLNLYHGTATTDADGHAIIELPDYFTALNRELSYQLTVIGSPARAWIEQEAADERFSIRTDAPSTRVAWLVLGVRQDAWAQANRIPVVEEKPPQERGFFLHPEAHGQPAELSVVPHPTLD